MDSSSPANMRPIIVWCGRHLASEGYGTAARLHVDALRELGAPVVAIDRLSGQIVGPIAESLVRTSVSSTLTTIQSRDPEQPIVCVVHDRPDYFPQVTVKGKARTIGYSYCETTASPALWAGWQTSMDALLVSSHFNRNTFTSAGVPDWMFTMVGHPVDPLLLNVNVDGARSGRSWQEGTVLLSMVDSVSGRRDLNLLLDAFAIAFQKTDDVALILKIPATNSNQSEQTQSHALRERLSKLDGISAKIYVVDERLTREQMARLHASVDIYVSCERGNGWDFPVMDSMTLGVPVVNIGYGGSTEFCDSGDTFTVRTSGPNTLCDNALAEPHIFYSGQSWPYVDPSDLAEKLRFAYGDPAERKRRAASAATRIRAKFNNRTVGSEVLQAINECDAVDLRSNDHAEVSFSRGVDSWPSTTKTHPQHRTSSASMNYPGDAGRYLKSQYLRTQRYVLSEKSKLVSASSAKSATRSVSGRLSSFVKKARHGKSLRETWTDYDTCLNGSVTRFEPREAEHRRRIAWSRNENPQTPSRDLEILASLRNRHLGERIFILGNGPSLTNCDLSLLNDEFTFGVNKIYLLFDQIDWVPSFYTLLDWKMGATVAHDLAKIDGMVRFYPERFRGILPTTDQTFWYWPRAMGHHIDDQFEPDIIRGIPSRGTVLVTAIQQAFFMGFRKIYLIGVDATYQIPATVRQTGPDQFGTGVKLHLESTVDDDPNHFAKNYFGVDAVWHDPNPVHMRRMFRLMRKGVERHGGQLLNATAGGSLDELPRVRYSDLFR